MVASLTARSARAALVVCALVAAGLTVGPTPAQAAVALKQSGPEVTTSGNSVTATLSSSSTAGTLLVAVLTSGSQNSFSGPSGWTSASTTSSSNAGGAAIWYYPNNPGGITSATFSVSSGSGGALMGELTEWSGVSRSSPLDQTGTNTCSYTTSCNVSTSGSTSLSNELGITIFTTGVSPSSYGAGSGWTHIFSDPANYDSVEDYKLGIASGSTVSETETDADTSAYWAAAIVTFKPGCTGGSLTLSAPGSASFASITLNGADQTATAKVVLTPDDETGNGSSWSGWNVTGTSTTLSTGFAGHSLSNSATAVTGASAAAATGNCALPTNSIGYPVTLPAGSSPPTAIKLYNAAANTGEGPTNVTLTLRVSVPANAYRGTYTSTWTFAIVSGP